MPTVAPPAVTIGGILADLASTIVSGPGQKARASFVANSGQEEVHSLAISTLETWTMIGLFAGRPLISKILLTAWASKALAARPYTVSVGRATSSPDFSRETACWTAAAKSSGVCVGSITAIF